MLREIDAQTGWSMAHMAAIYARLEKGEEAMDCLNKMVQSSLANNFFTLHNDWRGMNISLDMNPAPVQLDAIMGYVNAVQEMLVYSSEDLLKLLPALPAELGQGSVSNFRYENGLLSMSWNSETGDFTASMRALKPHTVWLNLPEFVTDYKLEQKYCDNRQENGFIILTMQENGEFQVSQTK